MLTRKTGYLTLRDDAVSPASEHLHQQGFVVLERVFDADEITALRRDMDRLYADYPPDQRSASRPAEEDNDFRYAALNRSEAAQRAVAAPAILDAIEPLLGEDCHVIANTCWRNPPRVSNQHGGGFWHIDAGPHVPRPPGVPWDERIPYPVFAIGAHLYLADCDLASGPTGVIPQSHKSGQHPPLDRLTDDVLTYDEQGEVALLARAGDVALFVSDVWHRRMPTAAGDRGRYFLQAHYGRRDIAQRLLTTAQANQLSEAAIERALSPRERTLIGLHEPFFYDG